MVRVIIGPNESKVTFEQMNTEINEWLNQHTIWVDDQQTKDLFRHPIAEETGEIVWSGWYRFDIQESKTNLLDNCHNQLRNNCSWFRIGYHECTHDESGWTGCTWDDQREWTAGGVTIPDTAPVFV